ncbi:hypothetical protein BJX61DRAFT_538962 [Aspergillus egyptiacus]|nr:hypothetical protein BJX61DRAFT_538962 [Aspergillus egyptiacus]
MAPRYALPDSESESEPDPSDAPRQPSDEELEKALRHVVANIYKTGNTEELTVKRVRLAAEKALQLEEGFFKTNGDWKARSDQIIKDEVEVQDTAAAADGADSDSANNASDTAATTKRQKPSPSSTRRKRRKTSDGSDAVDEGTEEPKKSARRQSRAPAEKKATREPSGEVIDDSDADEPNPPEQKVETDDNSESEMSVVLDEEPQPKRQRQKSAGTTSAKAKKKAPAKAKDRDADPDQAEIKRLQGWLIKCGIRKMWSRELAPYDTPKAKIRHLKDMLKDAGMEGRYSLEKAKRIKEERELREDLEMVQEGAKRWGKEGSEDDADSGQPRRRLNRGLKSLAFLESEGEETD